jgi:transcriptional regulator with XRE-family HTH domain
MGDIVGTVDDQDPGHVDRRDTEMNRRRLITRLVALRKSNRLTQADVAGVMRVSQSVVAEIESGRTDVRISTLERYASAVSLGQFKLELVDDPWLGGPVRGVAETLAAYGPAIDAAEFWSPPALDDLVREQGTDPIADPAVLALAGVGEGEWDDFFAAMDITG